MFKSKDKLTIMLTPEHLSMAGVRGGKIVQAERVELDQSRWDETWCGGLHQFDQPLRQLLARFGGLNKAHNADVFYISPGSLCRVDISDSGDATSVAKMKNGLMQSVGRANPADATSIISTENATVTLGIADDESNLQKLFAWLNRSKIVANRMVPIEVGVVEQSVHSSLHAEENTAILYLSARSSVIGYCEHDDPKLARLIEIGYDKLAGVYSRAMAREETESKDEQGNGSEQSGDCTVAVDGMHMLFKHGIPVSKDKSTALKELGNILPAMVPVLQRISIEIKQTFRFASSLDHAPSRLVICGPGAAIPMIGAAMAESLDMHVETHPDAKDYRPAELFGEGSNEQAMACGFGLDLELLPKAAKEIQTRTGLDRLLRVGGVAVAALIGGQYLFATHQLSKTEEVIAQQSGVIDRIELDGKRRESIRVVAGSIGSAAFLIEDTMGKRIGWAGFLSSMPNDQHPLIQVSELQGRMNSQRPVINLSGIALTESDDHDASQVLSQYIKALREVPEVKRIEIGSTSRSLIDESTWGLNFVLSIEIASEKGKFSDFMVLSHAEQGDTP